MPTQFLGTVQRRNPLSDLFTALQPIGQGLGQQLAGQPERKRQKEEEEKKTLMMIAALYRATDEKGRREMEGAPGWAEFQAGMAKYGLSTMLSGIPAEKPKSLEELKAETYGTLTLEQQQRKVTGEKLPEPPRPPKTIEEVAAGEIQKLREKDIPEEEWENWIRVKAGLEPTGYQAGTLENRKQKLVLEGERIGISRQKTTASIRFIDAKIVSMKTRDELSNQVALWKKEATDRKAKIAENNSEIRRLQVEGGLENQTKVLKLKTENQQHNHRMDELNYALDKADVESRIKVREEKVLQGWADLHRKSEELDLKREDTAARIKMIQATIDDLIKKGNLAEEANNWKRDATFRGLKLRQLEARIKEELGKGRLANQEELNRLRGVANEQRYQLGLLNAGIDLADLYLEAQRPAGKEKELGYTYKQIDGVTRVIKGEELIKDIPPPEGYVGKGALEEENVLQRLGKAAGDYMSKLKMSSFMQRIEPAKEAAVLNQAGYRYYSSLIDAEPGLTPEQKQFYKKIGREAFGQESALVKGLGEEVPGKTKTKGQGLIRSLYEAVQGALAGKEGGASQIAAVAEKAAEIRADQGLEAAEEYMRSQGFSPEQIANYIRKTRKK